MSRTFERDGYFCQTVVLPEHAGTHVDAPAHVRADLSDATVERMAPCKDPYGNVLMLHRRYAPPA